MPSLSRRRHAPKGPIKVKNNPMASTDPMGDLRPQGGRRCTAHSKQTGDRCKQPCVPGARVCHYHGGAAPHVKQAAQERLQIFQAPALDGLDPMAPLLYRATAPVCADGYCLETRELWGEDGRLVATNQQTFAIIQ